MADSKARALFKKGLSKADKGGAAFKKARKTKAMQEFTGPDGDYVCQFVSLSCGQSTGTNKHPYVAMMFVVTDHNGQESYEGGQMSVYQGFHSQGNMTIALAQEMFCQNAQRLGIETEELGGMEEVIDALEEMAEEKPFVKIRKKTSEGKGQNLSLIHI